MLLQQKKTLGTESSQNYGTESKNFRLKLSSFMDKKSSLADKICSWIWFSTHTGNRLFGMWMAIKKTGHLENLQQNVPFLSQLYKRYAWHLSLELFLFLCHKVYGRTTCKFAIWFIYTFSLHNKESCMWNTKVITLLETDSVRIMAEKIARNHLASSIGIV